MINSCVGQMDNFPGNVTGFGLRAWGLYKGEFDWEKAFFDGGLKYPLPDSFWPMPNGLSQAEFNRNITFAPIRFCLKFKNQGKGRSGGPTPASALTGTPAELRDDYVGIDGNGSGMD